MEAEESQVADRKRSGDQQELLSAESFLGAQLPQLQEQATSQTVHGSHGRQDKRPRRFDMLQRQKRQQQLQASGSQWQLSDVPGPSRSCSGQGAPSSQIQVQQTLSQPSLDVQEGTQQRRERKPPKPGKYVCTYCGRPCAKPSVLQKHIRSHTGERPYPCVPCGFSFKTKSNLYKHRKSHAHRIKAGIASNREDTTFSGPEVGPLGDDPEEATEGESTGSEDETGEHQPSTSHGRPTLKKSSKIELSFAEESPQTEDSQAVKQRLAMRLSERKRAPRTSSDEARSSLGPGSKGSTESGYFSSTGSAEISQVSPPNASAKTYAEIILGKYGRLGQQQRTSHQPLQISSASSSGHQDKSISFNVPKTQVIEHITKLITINEAVVDTSEIDSVKPRRSSVSRRSSNDSKFFSPKEQCLLEQKGFSGSSAPHISNRFAGELPGSYLADTDTGTSESSVLCRSHSVPSSGNASDLTADNFRLSYSFDDQQAVAAEMRVGPQQRMLRRQPAIEVPVGADLIIEEVGSSGLKESELENIQDKDLELYECEICKVHLKNRDSLAAHREACIMKPLHSSECKEADSYFESQSHVMSYKFKAMAMVVRKRKKKEESLEEDPPSPGTKPVSFKIESPSVFCSTESQGAPCSLSQNECERATSWKEISVIQHTRSFEKQESISMSNQEAESEKEPSQEPKATSTCRLIRQSNIQVPEILVTEEPDTEMVSHPATPCSSKVPEKVEEFQWPQRSQSLSQLPAEKLPPKKKRLRLAEAAQSSGESSFESVSLPHSPSQEMGISQASKCLDESGRPDLEMHGGLKTSQTSHMLTVPSSLHQHHHSHREMRRSSSEQASTSHPHHAYTDETRSKSFDYGSLSLERTSTTWKERRKCLLVKHGTLGEPDQEETLPKPPFVSDIYPVHTPLTFKDHTMGRSTVRVSPEHTGNTIKLFQSAPAFFPLQPMNTGDCSESQLSRFPSVTSAISGVLSPQMIPQAFIYSDSSHLQPQHMEHLGLYPQSTDVTQAVCFPITSSLTVHVPSGPLFMESSPTPSSQHDTLHSANQQVFPPNKHPVIAPCLQQLVPVVPLVVPVRLQTHLPTYASAMYTTISQMITTTQHPVCCTAMVIMGNLDQNKIQRSYLSLPSTTFKSYFPLPLSLEHSAGTSSDENCGQLVVGGSKRMLSPAGSLELSLEAQRQQKRVKEEDEEKKDEKEDPMDKCDQKSQETSQEKSKPRLLLGTKKDAREQAEPKKVNKDRYETESVQQEEYKDKEPWSDSRVERSEKSTDPSYPSLHTSTSVSWCYLNYTKPSPSTHQNLTSVYSSWSVSLHNPNIPGLTTKMLLSLLRSKQKNSPETYTMATASPPSTYKMVPTDSKDTSPSEVRPSPPNTPAKVKEEPPMEKRGRNKKSTEDVPTTSMQSETARVCIFEGGYRSTEDYVYVRGRGRGKYVCGECGIRCKKPSMLKKHIRTHTDVRPYVCKHCNFAFKTKGNLTKHMKSKAHGKKCLEVGASESLDELETEEPGGSEEHLGDAEDQEGHQFSDIEDSDDDEDEEEDLSSHEDPSSACSTDTRQSTGDLSESGQGSLSEPSPKEENPSPHRPWPAIRASSPGSTRTSFSRKTWKVSPRTFSPGSEGSPLRSLSPRLELSSPSRHLSPSPERCPSPIRALSPLRPLSPLSLVSPVRYRSPRALSSPPSLKAQHRVHSSPTGVYWETNTPATQKDKPGTGLNLAERVPLDDRGLSPAACFSPSEAFPPAPVTLRTVDRMFSHLPLHSQDQARMPYHMIPIGGIQMVQLRPRSRVKLERQSSSSTSPTSPKEESPFSISRREHLQETSPQTTQPDSQAESQRPCSSTSSTSPTPPSLQQGAVVGKQYCSTAKTHTTAADCDDGAVRESGTSQKTQRLHETEKPQLRARGFLSEESPGQKSDDGEQH